MIKKLTSRKFLATIFVFVVAIIGYLKGDITYGQTLTAIAAAGGLYSLGEGLADSSGMR